MVPQPGVNLILVAAPPGSGKTTLLGMWRDRHAAERPVAWLTIDDSDNDPVVLWSHVLEALRRACPELDVPIPSERVGATWVVDVVLPQIVNALAAHGSAALVLDDYHRLAGGPARDSVSWLVEHAPSTFQLVLAARREPALPLAALRARGQLLEVRAHDLAFTSFEAAALMNERLELGLDPGEVDGLVERTEGWAAGLYLAALSLRGVEDRHGFVSRFGGANRYVVDFLVDEVLEAHDAPTQALMLRSSVLERLSGPLCDAVLDQQGTDRLLSRLSRTNLFLLPLDDQGKWYRFHHLFAQLLRVELERREPGLAPTLHRRAYLWFRENGDIDRAIGHAQEACAFVEATDMIAGEWLRAASVGRRATVLAWLDRFPEEVANGDPRLLLMRAWMLSLSGRHRQAEKLVAALERNGWDNATPLPDGSPSLKASLATIRAGFPSGHVGAEARARRRAPISHDVELSERELVVLRMLGGPLSERDIGRELYLSHNTVHSHARSIYRKLGVSSRVEALRRGRELGLIGGGPPR
jgi:LuxR family maltose regulon positive regulatory protein